MFDQNRIMSGMVVRSSDGDKLGKVVSLEGAGFRIEKGIFFPKDFHVQFEQVDYVGDDSIYLKWGTQLIEEKYDSAYGAGSYQRETSNDELWSDYRQSESRELPRDQEIAREHLSVPLKEEQLEVQNKGMREAGRVRIIKTVRTEDQHFTIPLRREEVRIERVPTNEATGMGTSETGNIEEQTITIPVREEEVEVRKRPVVKEELRVTTESKTVEMPVNEQVRKEDVRIEREEQPKKKAV